jgi:HNH endonuclease
MTPLFIADGSLPPPLVQIPEVLLDQPLINDHDLLTVVGTLATDPNGPVWSQWSQSYTLLTDASCTPYPNDRNVNRGFSRTAALAVLSSFFALSPPSQADSHVALIASIAPIVPAHEVCWKSVIDMAHVIDFGLKAAMTRTGSRGHTLESTPKWMREQLDVIHDIMTSLPAYTQLLADTPVATQLRPNVPSRRVPSESQDSEDSVGDIGEQVRRDASAVGDCLSRDASSCVLTAETDPEVAHIIPFSCCSMTGYFDTSFFWLFLKFWIGPTVAQTVWQYVGGWNVNRLENLVSMGPAVHKKFGAGKLILEPPVRNRQLPNSAVILRIWEMYPNILRALSTEYAPLWSLDDALVVANNNARAENFHKFSSGEYVTLLPSDQSPLPDSALLAIFSAICRLRHLVRVVTELLESCHRNTNKDSSLPGGIIRDSQLNLPGVRPSDPSHQPKRPLPAPVSSPPRKPKNQKRDYHKRSTSSTRTLTSNSRGLEEISWRPDSHRAGKKRKRGYSCSTSSTCTLTPDTLAPDNRTHASRLHRKLSVIAREQHEGGVVMLGFQRWRRERDREAEERVARKIQGDTNLGDSDDDDGMAAGPNPEELRALYSEFSDFLS